MADGLHFELDDKVASDKLAKLKAAMGNLAPAYAVIGSRLATKIRLCFRLGVDPWGSPWVALKLRKGQPLRDTGRLQRSITSNPDSSGVTIGTNLIQAKVQQFGATIVPVKAKRLVFPGPHGKLIFAKKVVVPARPYMPITHGGTVQLPAEWKASVISALRDHLKKAVT